MRPNDPEERTDSTIDALFREVLARFDQGSRPEDADAAARARLSDALQELKREWSFARLESRRPIAEASRPTSSEAQPLRSTNPGAPSDARDPSTEVIERLLAHASREDRYRVEGEVGRGGMGTVFCVFDPDLRRRLAMKVALERPSVEASSDLRRRERVARFIEEAQVTGQLDHPGIVPVHELGLDAKGRLYFTMRLVQGRDLGAIYELARTGSDGWSQTRVLGVLLRCCEALAYANSKGVLHRDLKPSNVMVGGFGEVYVMDWGLAKILGRTRARATRALADETDVVASVRTDEQDRNPDTPLLTVDGTVLGTPSYMSPEQARGEVDRMDARSDVYSLGAMLYQLLAGFAPFAEPEGKLGAQAIWTRARTSRPKPLLDIVARTPPELVAICERAMEPSPDRRYAGAREMGDDLRAFLEGRVVRAYERGALAELRKWVKRNRGFASSSAAAVLLAILGLFATSYVEAKGRHEAESARSEAVLEAGTSREVVRFLTDMLEKPDPKRARGEVVTVKQMLDAAAARIDTEFPDRAELRARLMHTMSRVYKALDLFPQAQDLLEKTIATRRSCLGESHPDTIAALVGLADLHQRALRPDMAKPIYEEVLRLQRAQGEEAPQTLLAWCQLGTVEEMLDDDTGAEQCFRTALDAQRRTLGPDHASTLTTMNNLAQIYRKVGRRDEARAMLQEVIAGRRRTEATESDATLYTMTNLAALEQETRRVQEAERLFREVLDIRTRTRGEMDPSTLASANDLGVFLLREKRLDEAEPILRRVLMDRRRVLPAAHHETRESIYQLTVLLQSRGAVAEARSLARELLDSTPLDDPRRERYTQLADSIEQRVQEDPDVDANR